jgi:hypothetical protein
MVLSVDYSRRGELALRGVNPGAAALPQPQIPQMPAPRAQQVSSTGVER